MAVNNHILKGEIINLQQTLVTTQQITSTIGTRTISTLIGFLPERHAIQLLLQGNIVDAPSGIEELHALWEDAKKRSTIPPQHKVMLSQQKQSLVLEIKPLPSNLKHYEKELKSRPTYLRWYLGCAEYNVWCVPVCQLITPQWFADLNHIEKLAQKVPMPGDWESVLDFAFNEGTELEDPVVNPINNAAAIVFRAPAQNLRPIPIPEIRRINPHEFEIAISIQTAPNYLQVGRIRGGHVLINGIHRASALMKAGWEYIPCLVRKADNLVDAGFLPGQLGLIYEPQLLNRPPYLCDYFNPEIAQHFKERTTDQVLRVIPPLDVLSVPRS